MLCCGKFYKDEYIPIWYLHIESSPGHKRKTKKKDTHNGRKDGCGNLISRAFVGYK